MNELKDKLDRGVGEGKRFSLGRYLSMAKDGTKGIFGGGDTDAPIMFVCRFLLGFLLSGCHLIFSAYPFGIALVALMPSGLLPITLGAVVGSLTIGKRGVIYALSICLTLFLRILVSGGRRQSGSFSDGVAVRSCLGAVGGFIVGIYEIITRGFDGGSLVLLALTVIVPMATVFLLSGLFGAGITLRDLLTEDRTVLSTEGCTDEEKYKIIFFQLSALALLFITALSLGKIEPVGISLAYIFVFLVTLVTAKRFGAVKAMAVGFISSLGVSGVYSVSFALVGLGSGLIFGAGAVYAFVFGGVLASMWSGYCGGLEGLLSILPEYLIGAALCSPICKSIPKEREADKSADIVKSAKDMVGTVALKYRGRQGAALAAREASLSELASVIKGYAKLHMPITLDEYRDLVIDVAERSCRDCPEQRLCLSEDIRPCFRGADAIAQKLKRGEVICAADVNGATEFCHKAERVADEIMRSAARAERENQRVKDTDSTADEYEIIAKLVGDSRCADEAEGLAASHLTEPLTDMIRGLGFEDGVIRAFGSRRLHFIMAAEDPEGNRISSGDLRLGIERVAGVKLDTPQFYRNGDVALMECGVRRAYKVECASGRVAGDEREICGDTVDVFESTSDRFYALLSDGMGKGEIARDTSEFVASFMKRALEGEGAKENLLHLLNHAMRKRSEECSATVDLFEVDLLSGEATFYKCGAAPSFVKRDKSIFRIKSQTAPIGLLRGIDSERIKVEISGEDYVIMISDGVLSTVEDAPWFLELISNEPPKTLSEFVDLILSESVKRAKGGDDMSVIVMKISKI